MCYNFNIQLMQMYQKSTGALIDKCKNTVQALPFIEYFSMSTQIYKKSGDTDGSVHRMFCNQRHSHAQTVITNQFSKSQFPGLAKYFIGQEIQLNITSLSFQCCTCRLQKSKVIFLLSLLLMKPWSAVKIMVMEKYITLYFTKKHIQYCFYQ